MTEVLEFGKLLGKDMLSCSKIFLNFGSLCPLQSIDIERECYNILLNHDNIC